MRIGIPKMLSLLATRDADGFVPGVNDLLNGGYTLPNGETALSVDEKIRQGQAAILGLKEYRELKAKERADGLTTAEAQRRDELSKDLQANMRYFGYGYLKDKSEAVPFIPVCFYAFRIMVGLGMLFILFFAVVLFFAYRKDLASTRWIHLAGLALLPLGYIASESGWIVAEMGRQPWAIQDMMPTWVGVSDIGSANVMVTFFIFLALFTTLLAVEINILCKQIKKGPETGEG